MAKLRIRNLRSLEDTGPIELRPLTLLVGRNSSGKSTLLRALPLLRQSIEADTAGPLLWFGKYVDFGSFVESVRAGAKPPEVVLELSFVVHRHQRWASDRVPEKVNLTVSLTLSGDATTTTANKLDVSLFDHRVCLSFGKGSAVTEFRVNDLDVLSVAPEYRSHEGSGLLPVVWPTRRRGESRGDRWEARGINGKLINQLLLQLRPYFHGRTRTPKRIQVAAHLGIGSSSSMLDYLKRNAFSSVYFRNRVAQLTTESASFQQIRDLTVASFLPTLLLDANEALNNIFRNVSYTAPLRAAAERYYRVQGLAVEEVDPRGANLAMYLLHLSPSERQSFDEWTSQHLGFRVVVSEEGGHASLHLQEDESDAQFNLADLGFGFSQLLPVLTHIWGATTTTWNTYRRHRHRRYRPYLDRYAMAIMAIEQPELHLHPGMQARVADLLVALVRQAKQGNRNIALVIETHSEAIVNRIGEWVSRDRDDGIAATDCQILVFEKDAGGSSQIQQAIYSDDGFLENWPYGFFEPEA